MKVKYTRKELMFVHIEAFLETIRNQDVEIRDFLFHEKRKQLSFRLFGRKNGDLLVRFYGVNLLDFLDAAEGQKSWNLKEFQVQPFSDDRLVVEATLSAQTVERKIGFVASRWHYSLKK